MLLPGDLVIIAICVFVILVLVGSTYCSRIH